MTAATERLDAITARSEGLTDLCAEHLRQSIRHVQRNCDIDCNVHEDETTWDDCNQPGRGDGDRMAAVLADVAFLLDLARKQAAALEAVRELHKPIDVEVFDNPTTNGSHIEYQCQTCDEITYPCATMDALEATP